MNKNFWISSSFFSSKNIDDLVQSMSIFGLNKVELTAGFDQDEDIDKKLVEYEKEGFEFLIHNYFPRPKEDFVINLGSLDNSIQDMTVEHCKRSIELASKLKNKIFSVHAGFAFEMDEFLIGNMVKQKSVVEEGNFDIGKSFQNMVNNANIILNHANDLNVQVLFENNMIPDIRGFRKTSIPYHLIDPKGINSFFSELKYKNCGLILDVAHAKIVSEIIDIDPVNYFDITNIKFLQLSEPDGIKDSSKIFDENSWFFDKLGMFGLDKLILEVKESDIKKFENFTAMLTKL